MTTITERTSAVDNVRDWIDVVVGAVIAALTICGLANVAAVICGFGEEA